MPEVRRGLISGLHRRGEEWPDAFLAAPAPQAGRIAAAPRPGCDPGAGQSFMYSQLCSWDNLLLAFRKAAKGKRGQANVAAFEYCLEENLLSLQQELHSFTYRPGAYTNFYIHEPKRRLISAAPFRDRVVHHALCSQIEPIFERLFTSDSYANRTGKGTHRALDRLQAFTRQYRYALQCDVQQFFPSIDHLILRAELSARILDPGVLWLAERILESGVGVLSEVYEMVYFPGDDLFARLRPRGLPIGNLTSQFWANVYLNSFDHFVKRQLGCQAYLRYVDDFVLFAENKAQLLAWKQAIEARLGRLRLSIHPGAHPRPVSEGLPFLGFVVDPHRRRLKRRKGIAYQRKLRALLQRCRRGEIHLQKITASVKGWANHVRYGNTVGLRKAVLGGTTETLKGMRH